MIFLNLIHLSFIVGVEKYSYLLQKKVTISTLMINYAKAISNTVPMFFKLKNLQSEHRIVFL